MKKIRYVEPVFFAVSLGAAVLSHWSCSESDHATSPAGEAASQSPAPPGTPPTPRSPDGPTPAVPASTDNSEGLTPELPRAPSDGVNPSSSSNMSDSGATSG